MTSKELSWIRTIAAAGRASQLDPQVINWQEHHQEVVNFGLIANQRAFIAASGHDKGRSQRSGTTGI
jgi:hypothetical protein